MFVLDTERLTWSQPQTKVGLNWEHLFVLLEYLIALVDSMCMCNDSMKCFLSWFVTFLKKKSNEKKETSLINNFSARVDRKWISYG